MCHASKCSQSPFIRSVVSDVGVAFVCGQGRMTNPFPFPHFASYIMLYMHQGVSHPNLSSLKKGTCDKEYITKQRRG